MKITTQTLLRKVYKGGLFSALALIAFFIKLQGTPSHEKPDGLIESAHAEFPVDYGPGPDSCPSDGPCGP